MRIINVILAIIIFFPINAVAKDEKQSMKVDFVYDGDTFFADGERIRIWGIQAPEFKTRRYFRAGAVLEDMIVGKVIKCVHRDTDRYKRKVMQCWLNDEDISKKMIESGEAKEYMRFTKGYYKNKTVTNDKK